MATVSATTLETPAASVRTIRDLVSHSTSVPGGTATAKVVELFERNENVDSVAVLDQGFIGVVPRLRFFARIGRKFGYSLYENRPIRLLAEPGSVIDAHADPIEAIALATQRETDRIYDDLLVVDGGRFAGIVSMRALLVHHKNLLLASMADFASLDVQHRELKELHLLQSDFVARMTHELRSPLNTILGLVRLLASDPAVAERHGRNLELMSARGRDLLAVIDNILDIARMEAGAMEPLLETCDLRPLFEDAARSTEALLVGRPVQVLLEAADLPRDFPTDPSYLRRILTNLLANAAAATDVGEIRVEARCELGRLRVRVADTGHGIPPEALSRLFDRFNRIDTGSGRRTGSGLGLAIVKGLLNVLGGTITVESVVSVGTTFRFELPASPRPRSEGEDR